MNVALPSRSAAVAAVLSAALLLGACGGSSPPSPAKEPAAERARAPATLPALTEGQEEGSAGEAVMRLWYWAQWGNLPDIVAAYDPVVVSIVGVPDLTGTYSQQRSYFVETTPRVVTTRDTEAGTFVAVEARRPGGDTAFDSYLLRRREGGWRVLYDTFLERALTGYVTQRADVASEEPRRDGEAPSRAAQAQGQASAAALRSVTTGRRPD